LSLNPGLNLCALTSSRYVATIRAQRDSTLCRRVHGEIETPATERSWVITQTREGSTSEADMDCQLSEPTSQESV